MTRDDIEKLADWTKAKEVQTKLGPRLLRKADVTDRFSAAWREHKPEIKALGAGFSKNLQGEWELAWWMEIDAEEKANRARAIEESRATDADIELPCPEGLAYRPFQKAGIRYGLSHPSVLIGDDMGLGKTIQAIGIINSDPTIKTAIVVCPKSLKLNWYREMKKWLTRNFTIEIANGHLPHSDIAIVNYEGLIRIGIEAIKQRNFDIVICDEAHYIKNAKAQRSKAVKAIQARRKVRMTGTPICNRPAELYNLIEDMPNVGYWGSFFSFAKRYCQATNNGFGWDFGGASNLDELQMRLRQSCMVRRLKSEVLTELPAKVRQIRGEEAERLQDSLEEFGQVEPTAIGPNNELYNGHQRLKSWAAKFGDIEIDVRVSSRPLTEKEREKLTIFLHKGTIGGWDFDILANEFQVPELLEWGFKGYELGMPDGIDPNQEWQGMPEFEQEDLSAMKTIIVHFDSQEAVDNFSQLVGQMITEKTKSIYYPKKERADLLSLVAHDQS